MNYHCDPWEYMGADVGSLPPFQNINETIITKDRLIVNKECAKALERARKLRLCAQDKLNTESNWLIPYVIQKQSIVVLYAPAGSGKTFAAWGLAKFSYLTKKASEVFYFDGDNGLSVIFDRGAEELIKYKNFNYIAMNNPRIHKEFGEIDNLKLLKEIVNSKENLSNMLFVIDSLKDFVGELDMESGKDMKTYFRDYIMNLRLRGATIVLLHHTNKAIKKKDGTVDTNQLTFTGSQQILNSLETAYMVVPNNGDTAQQDGYIAYDFIGEKRRIGGNNLKLTVYTRSENNHKNLDIELEVPSMQAYIRNKKELKTIEKITNILLEHGDTELEVLFKKLKKHRRDRLLAQVLQDYELIFWKTYFSNRKKYLSIIKG